VLNKSSSYSFHEPDTTAFSDRPAFGGTCYSDLTMGTPVKVTAYGSSSITATSWWTATVTNAQAYAYPIEGYASGVAELKSILTNGDSTATESGSSSSAAAATYTASPLATIHLHVLAGTNPAFVPNSVSAEVGDIVLFQFTSGNHSVTESTFDHPCVRLPDGYDSGYMPNPNNAVVPTPEYSINISQNSSRWFYSKQSGECGSGMIFALNPSNEQTAKLFQLNAISQNGTSTESSAGMSTGVKVGVSIAAVAGAALILGLFFLFRRHRRNSTENATGSEYQAVGKTGRSGSSDTEAASTQLSEAGPGVPQKTQREELHGWSAPTELGAHRPPAEMAQPPVEIYTSMEGRKTGPQTSTREYSTRS
ncbi:hypothetical protein JHW43_002174, partial [Diplocarpon mali]